MPASDNWLVHHRWAILLLLTIAVLMRLLVASVYGPVSYGDTGTYFRFAGQIKAWDFSAFDGSRTPLYPLLILAASESPRVVFAVQQLLGIGAVVLVYAMAWQLTRRRWIAFTVGLLQATAVNVLFFEAALLTESLSMFLLLAAFATFFFAMRRNESGIGAAAVVGLVCALLALAHPLFVFVGPLLAVLASLPPLKKNIAGFGAPMLLAFLLPVIGWMGFNKAQIDYFGLTSFMGYNLSNHSGKFMELAPPGTIRDIFIKHRNSKLQRTGTTSMTVFEAEDELEQVTGLSRAELSKRLARISIELFIQHPGLYLQSVAEQWYSYWAVPNYWKPDKISNSGVKRGFRVIWGFEQLGLRIANVLFVLSAPLIVWLWARGEKEGRQRLGLGISLYVVVMSASVVQALVEFGQTRYSVTTQPLMLLGLSAWLYWSWRRLRGSETQA